MSRWTFIVLFLSGCAAQSEAPKVKLTQQPIKKIGVISTLGDNLLCTYTALTVFSNERQVYKLPHSLNKSFSEQLSSTLTDVSSQVNTEFVPLKRELIILKDAEQGASLWQNLEFNNSDEVDMLVIFDGGYHYKSKEGFYASDNALNTNAKMYAYEVASGNLLAEASQFKMNLKQDFSCAQAKIPKDSDILKLINQAATTAQGPLAEEVAKAIEADK